MFERGASTPRNLLAIGLIFLMVLPMVPAEPVGPENTGFPGPRTITDDASDLIVPAGETYELSGCHTYTNSIQINGTLKVKPYDGADITTGSLWLQARWILIGAGGTITADGRGYGGGGGASERAGAGGSGGTGGTGGAGDFSKKDGGGGGGSNGGAGGAAGAQGTAGAPGTEAGGGKGGDSTKGAYFGGAGGTGFGGGGGGGAGFIDPSGTAAVGDGGGGGGGGSGGTIGNGHATGGNGAGPAKGTGGQSQQGVPGNGNDGGYMMAGSNGDSSTDQSIVKGSGGGGGTSALGMAIKQGWGGGGGGGAGGGSVALVSDGDITIGGSVTTTGGGGGAGGQDVTASGGTGGGGAGGGVLLWGQKLTLTGSIDARGRTKNALATTNGGTVKIFYAVNQIIPANIQAGRTYTNGRPVMTQLLAPENNTAAPMRPTFEWVSATDPDSDAVKYQLQVSKAPDFTTLEMERFGIANTQQAAEKDLNGGPFYWRVRASDDWGNGTWSVTWKFFTDTTAPVSRMDPLPKYSTSVNFSVSWNGTDDSVGMGGFDIFATEDGGSFERWLTNSPPQKTNAIYQGSDGHSYSFYSIAIDKGGNREPGKSAAEANTTVDATPPTSKVAPMAAFQRQATFNVAWSGSDATSGWKFFDVYSAADDGDFEKWQTATVKTSADFSGEDGRTYTFYSIATDNAGNVQGTPEDNQMVKVKVDLTAPAVSARVGDPNLGTGPVIITPQTPITLDSEDGFSGMNGTFYIIDGKPAKTYAAAFRESSPGHHNLTYWGIDRAGNRGENGTLWFFVDNEAPVTAAAYDGPMATAGGKVYVTAATAISLAGTDAGCGLAKTEYKLDNAAYKAYTEPLKLATAGQHTILFRSVDKLGNSEVENTLKLTVDSTAPTTKAGPYDQLSKEDITILLTATDADCGVCATYYRILKEKATTGDYQNGTEVVIVAQEGGGADGNYTVQYYSVDLLGNKETVKELKLKIDTVVFLQVEVDKATVTKDRFTVVGRSEAGSKVSVNGEQVTPSADGSFSVEVSLKAGNNKITVQATDTAGNTDSKTVDVTYNVPATATGMLVPIVAIIAIAAGAGVGALLWMRKRKK
jgi:hypothetical protein